MSYRFAVVKLLDYQERRAELAASTNVFALVVEAYLATRETRHQPELRRAAKWKLVRLLYERRYSREEIVALFRLIDWMLHLPEEQAIIFNSDLDSLERELDMQYVASIERRALKRGNEQGRQQILRALLERRFGSLPEPVIERLGTATASLLDAWALRVLDARELDEVFC